VREIIRKEGDAFLIGDDISIVVLSAEDGQVELGITAPPAVSVQKREVYEIFEQIKQFNRKSVSSTDLDKAQNLFY